MPTDRDHWLRLRARLTSSRRDRMQRAAAHRTTHFQLVLQDIRDPHNISACLRSAEAFGILKTQIVTESGSYNASTVAKGVQGWLDITSHTSIEESANILKGQGYRIAAGFPRQDALPLNKLPIEQPLAVVFGNEHMGVHEEWSRHIDYAFTIPMVGLVESLNISVSCAISLYDLTRRAEEEHLDFRLGLEDQENLLGRWVQQQFPNG